MFEFIFKLIDQLKALVGQSEATRKSLFDTVVEPTFKVAGELVTAISEDCTRRIELAYKLDSSLETQENKSELWEPLFDRNRVILNLLNKLEIQAKRIDRYRACRNFASGLTLLIDSAEKFENERDVVASGLYRVPEHRQALRTAFKFETHRTVIGETFEQLGLNYEELRLELLAPRTLGKKNYNELAKRTGKR